MKDMYTILLKKIPKTWACLGFSLGAAVGNDRPNNPSRAFLLRNEALINQ
jgi:hypothetical protein